MDGNPVPGNNDFKLFDLFKDEIVPVRMFLSNFELTPSYKQKENIYTVQYYISLVLIEQNGRKYFKRKEI